MYYYVLYLNGNLGVYSAQTMTRLLAALYEASVIFAGPFGNKSDAIQEMADALGMELIMTDTHDAATLIDDLKQGRCFNNAGVLLNWPRWLKWEDIQALVRWGYMTRQTFGPETFSHTEYKLVTS